MPRNFLLVRATNPHMTDPPRVSVCLLAYNHAALIEDSIRSALAQDETNFELTISDDCSRDNTWEILERIAKSDARVRPIRPPHNLGMAGNANFAVSQAKAPYVALLNHEPSLRASPRRGPSSSRDHSFVCAPSGHTALVHCACGIFMEHRQRSGLLTVSRNTPRKPICLRSARTSRAALSICPREATEATLTAGCRRCIRHKTVRRACLEAPKTGAWRATLQSRCDERPRPATSSRRHVSTR